MALVFLFFIVNVFGLFATVFALFVFMELILLCASLSLWMGFTLFDCMFECFVNSFVSVGYVL